MIFSSIWWKNIYANRLKKPNFGICVLSHEKNQDKETVPDGNKKPVRGRKTGQNGLVFVLSLADLIKSPPKCPLFRLVRRLFLFCRNFFLFLFDFQAFRGILKTKSKSKNRSKAFNSLTIKNFQSKITCSKRESESRLPAFFFALFFFLKSFYFFSFLFLSFPFLLLY